MPIVVDDIDEPEMWALSSGSPSGRAFVHDAHESRLAQAIVAWLV